jgi:Emfourin
MKVGFRQSGGFAGLVRGIDLDTSKLDADQASELEQLVAASGIQGTKSVRKQAAPDQFQYEITIEQDDQISKLSFDEHTLPTAAQPLYRYLKPQARPMPLDSALR